MVDKALTAEGEDPAEEFEIVEVEALPEPGAEPPAKAKEAKVEDDEEDEEEDVPAVDARLVEEEEDEDSAGRKDRLKRRQRQKAARDAAQAELAHLRTENKTFAQRLAALEGRSVNTDKAFNEQKLQEARDDVRRAELLISRAVEAGNGDDVVEAQRLRDEARERSRTIEDFGKTLVAPVPITSQVGGIAAVQFKQQWLASNPWFRPGGTDEEAQITSAIDNAVAAEGFNPDTVEYWNELTKRVARRLFPTTAAPKKEEADEPAPRKGKRAPPMGDSRSNAPASTRQQVHVTPERKQAMIDGGYWEDPVKRNQMLKAYAEHDRSSKPAR